LLEEVHVEKITEIMTDDFPVVSPSAPIIEVAQKLADHRLGYVAVCNDGKFKGLVAEADVIAYTVARGHNPRREHARDIMKNHFPAVLFSDSILEVAKVMIENGVRILPVLKAGKFMGVVTVDDLTKESLSLASLVYAKTIRHHTIDSEPAFV
jgi:CBS domain-containing protein